MRRRCGRASTTCKQRLDSIRHNATGFKLSNAADGADAQASKARIVRRISRDLFLADGDVPPDFTRDLYASAVWSNGETIAAE